jgi:hypothetical protein
VIQRTENELAVKMVRDTRNLEVVFLDSPSDFIDIASVRDGSIRIQVARAVPACELDGFVAKLRRERTDLVERLMLVVHREKT